MQNPKIRTAIFLSSLMAPAAFAAGFQINPTASSVARSMGGNGIIGEDIGDMFFNPAALMLFSSQEILQLGGNYLQIENQFRDQGSFSTLNLGNGPIDLPLTGTTNPSEDSGVPIGMFYTRPAPWNENIQLGASITSPWGLSTTYDFDWVGRYHATSSELRVIDLNLSASWRMSSTLVLGVGISAQSAEATLIQAVPDLATGGDLSVTIEGDDQGLGFNAGLIWSATSDLKLGLSYRSKVEHDLDGDRLIANQGTAVSEVGAVAPLTIPESWILSAHYQPVGKKWSIAAGIRRTEWSRFQELRVDFKDASPSVVSPQNWVDSYTSGLSIDYAIANNFKLIASIGYDETPVRNALDRSAQVPEFDRRVVGFGFDLSNPFNLCETCNAYFGYHRTMVKSREILNTNEINPAFSTTLNGYYEKGHVDVFSGHFTISF